MIITCEKCNTQYAVPSDSIGPEGRTVKCSNCAHTWQQHPIAALSGKNIEKAPKSKKRIPKGGNLPAMLQQKKVGIIGKAVFVLLLLTSIFTGVLANKDAIPLPDLYDILGMKETDGLIFRNVTIEKLRVDNKLEFLVKAEIANESSEVREVPDIYATTFTKGGRPMDAIVIEPSERILSPGASIAFEPEITGVSGNADLLTLDLGNAWELYFR